MISDKLAYDKEINLQSKVPIADVFLLPKYFSEKSDFILNALFSKICLYQFSKDSNPSISFS